MSSQDVDVNPSDQGEDDQRPSGTPVAPRESDIVERDTVLGDKVAGDKIQGDKVEGSKIEVGDITVKGRGQVTIAGRDIVISGRHYPMWQPAFVLAVALAVLIFWLVRPTPPGDMYEDFNLAVSKFQLLSDNASRDALDDIDQSFYARLDEEIRSIGDEYDIRFGVRSPQDTGIVSGSDPNQRDLQAEKIAEDIQADVLIYGVVRQQGATVTITPQFFVNLENFYEAEEVVGQYRIGGEIVVELPLNPTQKRELNKSLADKAKALALVTFGLSYYSDRDYPNALTMFEKALQMQGFDKGFEVPLVLAGSCLLKMNDSTKAESYCSRALQLSKDYSRAYLCMGSVRYQQALEHTPPDSYSGVDLGLLEQAIGFYKSSLAATDRPPGAEVAAKAHLALGQAYLIKGLLLKDNAIMDEAVASFETVISSYGRGDQTNPRVQDLAAHAYAHLGLILRLNASSQQAIPYYQKAYELTLIPERARLYARYLGDIYRALGDEQSASHWYELAGNEP